MAKTMEKQDVRELKTRDLMHEGCITIRSDATLSSALQKMKQAQVSSLLVEPREPGDAYGIVTRRDLIEKAFVPGSKRFNFSEHRVFEVMTKPVVTVAPGLKAKYTARLMKRENVRRLPVFDGETMVGMIADSDIFKKLEA